MIRPALTEIVLFLAPFVLYAVLWATRAGVIHTKIFLADLARPASLAIVALALMAGGFISFRALHERAAGLYLRAGAHGERQIRAGRQQVMEFVKRSAAFLSEGGLRPPPQDDGGGATSRSIAGAAWLTTGALSRLLGAGRQAARRRAWSAARCATPCSASRSPK